MFVTELIHSRERKNDNICVQSIHKFHVNTEQPSK